MTLLIPLAVAAVSGLYYLSTRNKLPKGTPGNLLPTPDNIPKVNAKADLPKVPAGVKGTASKHVVKSKTSDRTYTMSTFAPNAQDKVFTIAQLNGTTSWMSYFHDRKTGARKLHQAFSKGDRDQSGRVVSMMMSDFSVKK